jgi:hypothetical protein
MAKASPTDRWLSVLAIAGLAVSMLSGLFAVIGIPRAPALRESQAETSREKEVVALRAELRDALGQLGQLQAQLEALSSTPPGDTAVAAEQAKLAQSLASVDQRLGQLEAVIFNDPTKVLQVPLLAERVQALEKAGMANFAVLREDINRLQSNLNSSVIALAIAILGAGSALLVQYFQGRDGRKPPGVSGWRPTSG